MPPKATTTKDFTARKLPDRPQCFQQELVTSGTRGLNAERHVGESSGIEADFGPEHAETFRPDLRADYVLAKGSMCSNQSGEGDIRHALIEADLVDCTVALPGQLFYSTQIPVCFWFLAKNKNADAKRGFHDRSEFENNLALAA